MRLIDADALREDVEGLHMTVTGLRAGKGALAVYAMKYRNSLDRLIDEASTIDAVPVVHGRWIHPKCYVVSNGFLCSECGHSESSHRPINPRPGGCCLADEHGNFFYPPKINYCPNCGAKMDLEVDGDG